MNGALKAAAGLVALCLVGGALAAPAGAKRKPKRAPAAQTHYLVNANETGCARDGMVLRLSPTNDNAAQCVSASNGAGNEVYTAATGEPCRPNPTSPSGRDCGIETFTADEGLPLVLDTTRPVTGSIFVSPPDLGGGTPRVSVGPSKLHFEIHATIGGEEDVIGTFTSPEYLVTPTDKATEIPFEIALDPALDKATVTELSLDLWTTGVAPAQVYEPNASHLVLPVWK